jgi:hypothetical protein
MASVEGIRSPISPQASARSSKLRFYESLFLWNQGVDQILATLRNMEKFPFVRKSALQYYQTEIEEVRSEVNADFMEELADRELDDGGRFSKERRAYEKKREDPDDVYIDVRLREEERKKQGLPPRIGILPFSAVADQEKCIEEDHERKQRRPGNAKSTAKPKSSVRGKSHA